jgi:bacteriophage N4 adsorption protein B
MVWFDAWVAACLAPLAVWILLSGLDDLFIDAVFVHLLHRPFSWPDEAALATSPQRRIAILVPLWQEHAVIGPMLRHNLSVIRYANYDFFVGVYPNDRQTARAVREIAAEDPRVHVAVCPTPGPTSKADCLNHTYYRMMEYESHHSAHFDIVVTHDAEDLIHPESLRLTNWYSRDYEMVQIPVLPLRGQRCRWTRGLYCDEFAEYQFKDIPVRQYLRGFLPSNGVGTGFARFALESLAREHQGQPFDPECLTEDYEAGFRMQSAGYRQIFLPIRFQWSEPMATREYFPSRWSAAVRQRSRWVAGIVLQGWEQHGWRAPLGQRYWLWRDRKGLVGNLLSPITNLLFLAWLVENVSGYGSVRLTDNLPFWIPTVCWCTAGIALAQIVVRIGLCARVYGAVFAMAAPLRMLWGNVVNCAATVEAIRLYLTARIERRALAWGKTEHLYPSEPLLIHRRPRLGEVLVSLRCLSGGELEHALAGQPRSLRLGEYLVQLKKITERDLEHALESQSGRPYGPPAGVHAVYRNFGLDST